MSHNLKMENSRFEEVDDWTAQDEVSLFQALSYMLTLC